MKSYKRILMVYLNKGISRFAGDFNKERIWNLMTRDFPCFYRNLYSKREMIYVERTLADLAPRYGAKSKINVSQVSSEELRDRKYPFPPEYFSFVSQVLEEGCRLFIGYEGEHLIGWMLLGKKCQWISREYLYDVAVGEKELVAFDIFVFPAYRKGGAAGALEEKVLLKLKEEGYNKVLGSIDALNKPSISLARHIGYKEVKRVYLMKLFFLKYKKDKKPVPEGPVPLQRSGKDPRFAK